MSNCYSDAYISKHVNEKSDWQPQPGDEIWHAEVGWNFTLVRSVWKHTDSINCITDPAHISRQLLEAVKPQVSGFTPLSSRAQLDCRFQSIGTADFLPPGLISTWAVSWQMDWAIHTVNWHTGKAHTTACKNINQNQSKRVLYFTYITMEGKLVTINHCLINLHTCGLF